MTRGKSLLVITTALAACSTTRPNAAERLAVAESRLVSAERLTIDYEIMARGAFSADLSGRLECVGDDVRLTWSGAFGGKPEEGAFERTDDRPPALREAFLIGLTRMGILHNLARLSNGAEPDRADGTVREWVRADEPVQAAGTVSFGIVVDDRPSGSATLWFDDDDLPARRQQTVDFGSGKTMRVAEIYRVSRQGG